MNDHVRLWVGITRCSLVCLCPLAGGKGALDAENGSPIFCQRSALANRNRDTAAGSDKRRRIEGRYDVVRALYSAVSGRLRGDVKFDPAITPQGFATLDVCANTGREVLTKRRIDAGELLGKDMSASLAFSCSDVTRRVEIRLRCEAGFVGAIQSVEISGEFRPTRVGDGFSRSDLPLLDVENELRQGRNLYDGYQRGQGLAIEGITEKLKSGLDFQEAL